MRQFLMGNEILARAAFDAGAKVMFAYPITPASEILETWISFCHDSNIKHQTSSVSYLQAEDEMAAGFGVIGSCLAGVPAFTATAGPGNVLMQDAFSMAEALRIPTVAMIMQRGGLSTSTVIYSQEEVMLTCFGGNGEGFRIVYSPSNLKELYDYTLKAFIVAWQYRFPTFILADGYQAKMKGEIEIDNTQHATPARRCYPPASHTRKRFGRGASSVAGGRNTQHEPILKKGVNLRNCYDLEEEIGEVILNYSDDYAKMRSKVEESEEYRIEGAEIVLIAHGIVAAACKTAVDELRKKGLKAGLFRPITLRPFPIEAAVKILTKAKQIITLESALGQLARLFKDELYWINVPLTEINKPAVGFTPEEIVKTVEDVILNEVKNPIT